ncbi:formimidoylglutamase [Pseudodesulfovibrio sediminis]|uniref:Arginase n=1 Tax=Pseudodesulfovibrio sediminis TaxID=2810563 RepID=A0ABN6EU21_9BACT|nr:formimidoylglutamase [Pseudodesulfovibrio sediminis]BCS89813.1 arginase [Pseudodesulfovibrio sediminis]
MIHTDLLSLLTPPEMPGPSHDDNDILLRDVVSTSPDDLNAATHVIIGCPQDQGVARNHGRPGAAQAPAAIRQMFYKLKPATTEGNTIVDLGDMDVSGELEAIHDRQQAMVTALLAAGKTVISLGGGNDISLPDASGVHAVYPEYAAINMDAHLDMRISDRRHSGTPYRNLIDAGALLPDHLYEVGIQTWANAPHYLDDARAMGVNIHPLTAIHAQRGTPFFTDLFTRLGTAPLFAGLDMDSVRASDAPGVSASCPVGFSARDILEFADRCRTQGNTAVFEITEVNPNFDIDGRTARLAALAVYAFIYGNQ